MTDRRPAQATALALALMITLSIFSGVSQLSSPSHASPMLASTPTVQASVG